MRFVPVALIGLSLAMGIGCFRPPVFNQPLQPAGTPDRWVHGRAYLHQVSEGLEVRSAFVEARGGMLVFDLQVLNRGKDSLLVSPELVSCRFEGFPAGGVQPFERLAEDPEQKILELRKTMAITEDAKGGNLAFRGVFLLLDMADSVANDGQRTPQERREIRQEHREIQRDLESEDRRADERVASFSNSLRQWEEECVRKTTLDPGYGLKGRVVFHVDAKHAEKVSLRVPLGAKTFQFEFRPR